MLTDELDALLRTLYGDIHTPKVQGALADGETGAGLLATIGV